MSRGYNKRTGSYVNVLLTPVEFDELVKQYPQLEGYRDDFRWKDQIEIAIRNLSIEMLTSIRDIFKKAGKNTDATVMSGYLNVTKLPEEATPSNLRRLEPAIFAWLRWNLIRGWIFNAGTELPELVTDVRYNPPDDDEPAYVYVSTKYWSENKGYGGGFRVTMGDLAGGRNIGQIFFRHGYLHEDRGLIAQHDAYEKKFLEWKSQTGMQFVSKGSRVVNDFDHRPKPVGIDIRTQNNLLIKDDGTGEIDEEQVTRVPVHPSLWCFDLAQHKFGWHEIKHLTPYTYNSGLRDVLVLPEDHRDLIDALVTDLSIVVEDVIEGKSGGTTILCQGLPGTGKTLTAEVYAEAVKRPLYRVHSGQLGTEPQGLEKMLVKSLKRAERWNAILLIDEADVFLMQRTNDLRRNAVVGVFLRVLEYYKGILFLTTNRLDAIDDAIVSRCIAVIKYGIPSKDERKRMWQMHFSLAETVVSDELVERLASAWECSGRDIKGLVKLTVRYCRARNKTPEFDDFVRMGAFRGMSK